MIVIGLLIEGRLPEWLRLPHRSFKSKKLEIVGSWIVVIGVLWELCVTITAELETSDNSSQINELKQEQRSLSANMQWRAITTEQKKGFIYLMSFQHVHTFPIKIRMGPVDAESESFAYQIRDMLDSSGFEWTNKADAIGHWPNGELLGLHDTTQKPTSVVFLNNLPEGFGTNLPVKIWEVQNILKTNTSFNSTSSVPMVVDIIMTDTTSPTPPSVSISNGVIVYSVNTGWDTFKLVNFQKVAAAFEAIGITTCGIRATNLNLGDCEIYVQQKY